MKPTQTVLFIDDDKHLARIVCDFLRHERYNVHTAASAEEGLLILETLTPDVVVLDISMPGMGGIGFLKRITKPDGTLQYPVLVLTARAVMKDFFDTVAVDDFLPKPCSELDLIRKIREIIAKNYLRKQDEQDPARQHQESRKLQIVFGEDDFKVWPGCVKAFVEYGFDVKLAGTGPEVLEKTVEFMPDAVVMKEMMPSMNGATVASLIKTMPHTRHIPVIVNDTTCSTSPEDRNIQSVDTLLFRATAIELIAAVRKSLD